MENMEFMENIKRKIKKYEKTLSKILIIMKV